MNDPRYQTLIAKSAQEIDGTTETVPVVDTKQVNALIEVMKADKAVSDAYYIWVDKHGDSLDNPEGRAWVDAMLELARAASNYIDSHAHPHSLSPVTRPKDYQEDAIAKEARRQMGWG